MFWLGACAGWISCQLAFYMARRANYKGDGMVVRDWKQVAKDRLEALLEMQVRATIAEAKVSALQLELADERGAYNALKEMFDAMIDCGDCQSIAKIKARAEAAEAKLKVREAAFVASEQDVAKWADRAQSAQRFLEAFEKLYQVCKRHCSEWMEEAHAAEARVKEHEATIERLTEIQEAAVIDEAQLAWARARVKVLEKALREIERYCAAPADSIAKAALAAKEKP